MNSILSALEADLFSYLIVDIPISTDVLIKKHFGDNVPPNAHKRIVSRLKIIETKLENASSEYKICRSKRNGPHPITVWLEKIND